VGRRAEAAARSGDVTVRVLAHRAPIAAADGAETVHGDLTDAASLRGMCEGVDVVLHLAARISGDLDQCHRVNVEGTRALLAEAARAGVGRVVQLSTTGVYKDGRHEGAAEGELELGPVSAASRTRLMAEELTLAMGGTVLRPHLVYGSGDAWVVPALADALRRIPHWVEGAGNRVSLVAVDDLAEALARLARLGRDPRLAGRVLHANHPQPLVMREVLTHLAAVLEIPLPHGEISADEALRLLGAAQDPGWRRKLSLLSVDHWYDNSLLWSITGCPPGPGFARRLAEYAPWYRARLGLGAAPPTDLSPLSRADRTGRRGLPAPAAE
jgi:nucleoside-diphosphate-sugar epimerase